MVSSSKHTEDPRGRIAHRRIKRLFLGHLAAMEALMADPLLFAKPEDAGKADGPPERMDMNRIASFMRLLSDTEKLRREIYRCPTWKEEKDQQWKMRKLEADRQRLRELSEGGESRIILSAIDEEEEEAVET
ncbi:MAG: hypothetical protein IJ174_08880 [Clostridia bacterium]|nr:hypothetical protein [Clostridia bacterium]